MNCMPSVAFLRGIYKYYPKTHYFSSWVLDKAYINGEWVKSKNGKTFNVTNPANGTLLGNVPDLEPSDAEYAIQCAHQAFYQWKKFTAKERSKILRKWADLIFKNSQALSQLLTAEMGKPLKDALGEVNYAAEFVDWFSGEARRVYGDVIQSADPKKRILTIKQPAGVAATITPWNFPFAMVTRKVAPALAAGCTVVLKPAEDTPLCALALCKLAEEAGIPPGVLNCVTTSHENVSSVGKVLCKSHLVRVLSFTGSSHTGKILLNQCSNSVKKVSMELGGNAPFIVFNSANLELAVNDAVACKFRSSGQTCVCANRFLVQDGIYDKFMDGFSSQVNQLKMGDGTEDDVKMGPLINARALKKISNMVEDAKGKGGHAITGGEKGQPEGWFYKPTIIGDATTEMICMNEESFGPVAPVIRFQTEEEALDISNNTNYGLAGYIFTENIQQAWRVSEQLEVGMVGINEGLITYQVSEAPLGGIKESGLGREGSKYGMDEYLEVKYMCMGNMS